MKEVEPTLKCSCGATAKQVDYFHIKGTNNYIITYRCPYGHVQTRNTIDD